MTLPGRRRSILFAEQYYFPEGWGGAEIPRDITMHLARQGYSVEVVCGSDPYAPVHPDEHVEDPSEAGVQIVRLARILGGDIKRGRVLRQLWFYMALLPVLMWRRAPDLYIAQTNPPLVVVILALVAALRRVPLVIVAQDLYPESLVAHGLVGPSGVLGRMLRFVFNRAYRSASRVVVLGPFMRRRVLDKGVSEERIRQISNWATGGLDSGNAPRSLRARWGLDGAFVLLYSGNMGIGHEFTTLLDAVETAATRCPALRVVFVGKGSRLAEVRAGVEARGLQPITQFREFVPASELNASLAVADLAIVTLREGFEGLIVPSKFFGYMARGVATLYIGPDSDISTCIRDTSAGIEFRNGDSSGVADAIVRGIGDPASIALFGAAARSAYAAKYDKQLALAAYAQVVGEIIGDSRS